MTSFTTLLQQGNSWLFVPSAVLLGALHGLEPGHSKTMMAAFIVAIRGTVAQAVLLGLAATLSHTAVVWVVALAGLHFGRNWNSATSEPYFQLGSAVLIVVVGAWMLWRARRDNLAAQLAEDGGHDHDHGHSHEDGHYHGHDHHGHGHAHDFGQQEDEQQAVDLRQVTGFQDAHELAHAEEIRRRFANRQVTTGQLVLFGLTGGLIPCPASITVLLLCLQLKQFVLGATLVLCFSIGLALTMVTTGTIAALGVRHAARRFSGFGTFARRAPYFSGAMILLVGLYVGYQGWHVLAS
ncbi:MAG: nickel/cobalt efflux transporter RcnA [Proteobacteria bacterium]|nr:nickel/cobalt efflux transporter RcnA [Pseudomonadota bacterium]